MKFKEMIYTRPNLEEIQAKVKEILACFREAKSFEEQEKEFLKLVEIQKDLETQGNLVHIRYTVNTLDPFYEKENDFWDENTAIFASLGHEIVTAVLDSPYLEDYRRVYGDHFVDTSLLQKKTFDPVIMEDLNEESKWGSKYQKLMAGLQIPFEGKNYTLPEMTLFLQNPQRETRKAASDAIYSVFTEKQTELDEIYDHLVKIRHKIAKKLGYENFIQLGYDRMGRTDYGAADVERYREGVREYLVPMAEKIFEEQRQRLGVDKLHHYDLGYEFPRGMPKPQGDAEYIVGEAAKMYKELSPETDAFFSLLQEQELMDLLSKKGKAPGGYCTFIENYGVPFIFANFNGTIGDVNVLTHEFGHAFQVYSAKDLPLSSQRFPGMEAAEIHSMGMEFITWPWMENFFKEDTEKFFYSHAASAITFIPYGALVDHFQHEVYAKPEMTPEERRAKWRELEKIYNPWKDYAGYAYLEKGGFWQKQGHIYEVPFYYIDYTLAQIVALQIFKRSREDRKKLWEDYKAICKVGGSLPFLEILKVGHFENPFNPEVVGESVSEIQAFLEKVDASQF